MTISEYLERFTDDIEAMQRQIAEELTPTIHLATHEFHVFWFELLPWHRRLWHIVTGHRHPEDWLGLAAPSSEKGPSA